MCMKELMLKSIHDLSYTVLVSEKGLTCLQVRKSPQQEGSIRQKVTEVLFSRKVHLSAWSLVYLPKSVGEDWERGPCKRLEKSGPLCGVGL